MKHTRASREVTHKLLGRFWFTKNTATQSVIPRRTFWFWDGAQGWYTSRENKWKLEHSRFDIDRVLASGIFRKCADPRPLRFTNEP